MSEKKGGCLRTLGIGIGVCVVGCGGLGLLGSLLPEPTPEQLAERAAARADAARLADAARAEADAVRLAREAEEAKALLLPKEATCRKVSETFGSQRLSDLQKEVEWEGYDGRVFVWDVVVGDVSKGMLGGYTIQAKCPGSSALVADIHIHFPSSMPKADMARFEPGKRYTLSGKLTRYGELLGLSADWVPMPE